MDTNPVVIRRIMAGLRDQGLVRSEKGHGGGWTISCDLSKVTLRDIYAALGSPSLLAIGNRTEAPGCLIEQSVNAALGQAFRDAESLLLSRLGDVTLAHVEHRRAPAPRRPEPFQDKATKGDIMNPSRRRVFRSAGCGALHRWTAAHGAGLRRHAAHDHASACRACRRKAGCWCLAPEAGLN